MVDVSGAFPPNPLAAAQVVFPYVIQEASRLRGVGAVAKAGDKEQVSIVWTEPTGSLPQRAPGTLAGAALVVALETA